MVVLRVGLWRGGVGLGRGARERGGGLGCVSALRVRCVPRVSAGSCVVYVCGERGEGTGEMRRGVGVATVWVWGGREWGVRRDRERGCAEVGTEGTDTYTCNN